MNRREVKSNVQDRQLELGLSGANASSSSPPPQPPPILRAEWWFDRMRRTVAEAIDWSPHPPARPEQVPLALSTL